MFAFSLIIPVFNEGKNITNLVYEIYDSLKNYKDFEVILVNDYSNDNKTFNFETLRNLSSLDLFWMLFDLTDIFICFC